jgi:carbon-monoxide dehydrogenase medium subunit
MSSAPEFVRPQSIEEAIGLLERYGDDAKVVAGATAMTVLLQRKLIAPRVLVSLDRLPRLRTIQVADGTLHLGALVAHREVERSEIVRNAVPVLAEAFGAVGNVRVRNAATVGGVLAEADYASDPPTVLAALEAMVELQGPKGVRAVPAGEFIRDYYETVLEPADLVVGVRVPVPPKRSRARYEKFSTRSAEDRPCVGVAGVLNLDARFRCERLRIVVGAVAGRPQRFPELERLADGEVMTSELAAKIAEGYAASIQAIDDLRGSAWYRQEMVRVLVRRVVEELALGEGHR